MFDEEKGMYDSLFSWVGILLAFHGEPPLPPWQAEVAVAQRYVVLRRRPIPHLV